MTALICETSVENLNSMNPALFIPLRFVLFRFVWNLFFRLVVFLMAI